MKGDKKMRIKTNNILFQVQIINKLPWVSLYYKGEKIFILNTVPIQILCIHILVII